MRSLFKLSLVLCLLCSLSRAETLTIYKLGDDELLSAPNINAFGIVEGALIHGSCGLGALNCYAEFQDGQRIYDSAMAPADYVPDDGTPCSAPNLAGAYHAICNNGYEVYAADHQILEIFPGGDPLGTLIERGSADILRLNSAGDFLIVDAEGISTYQVMLSAAPEPSSVSLLGTGLLGALGLVEHRRRGQPSL